ncbi:hypothetical protein [Legionella drancourtii]|uniref:Uncharacterized protein n=1 Tax=Legionella drancourtii LLAP12 TaxID=658187 RepID=G9EM41_9GAMM|nr:hypothetical protein [Legionella drancourtii]EHL31641.1 hypothetical protein LDG_6303 [Legionella drancourtii LLAP12]
MPKNEKISEDAQKTSALFALGALILAPLLYLDTKFGITAALIVAGGAIYQLHEIGRTKRTFSNAMNTGNTLFSGLTGDKSTELENAAKNVFAGGGAVFDEIFPPNKAPK